MTNPPDLSVVVPVYNRFALVDRTLRSLATALNGLAAEVVIVDDGSQPGLNATAVPSFNRLPAARIVRQTNAGSAAARVAGLRETTGRFVAFLDSDDLVAPEKYRIQLEALQRTGAGLAYSDEATVEVGADGTVRVVSRRTLRDEPDPLAFLLREHAFSHNPVFFGDWLRRRLLDPAIPLHPIFRPIGDTWSYHNLAWEPRSVVKVPGDLALATIHPGERYSARWEITGVGASALLFNFTRRPPPPPIRDEALRHAAESAVLSARALPNGMPAAWLAVIDTICRAWPVVPAHVGGRGFCLVARVVGVHRAVKLMRQWQRPDYSKLKSTVTADELRRAVEALGDYCAMLAPSGR